MNSVSSRIAQKPVSKRLTVHTILQHFSIITYSVPYEKLRAVIPSRFEIYTITLNEKKYGLVSAVTFIDKDFRFNKIFPFLKFKFPQTNYRAYVIDTVTGEKCAWFFGTSLGSWTVFIPKRLWKMPWFYSGYKTDFTYANGYTHYQVNIHAPGANANIDICENKEVPFNSLGFEHEQEAELVLTHPVTGFFNRSDGKLGRYKIWHPKMEIRNAICNKAYFEKFENLNLLTRQEMLQPYSVLVTPAIEFIIDLPPVKV